MSSGSNPSAGPAPHAACIRRHTRFAWWSLFVFLSLGMLLEILHALKIGWYLDVSSETRRLMWTLAHAHGTLLALIHAAFASTLPRLPNWAPRRRDIASHCLIGASLLLPGGFFVGGIWIYEGDPGLGVLIAPVGGLLLAVAVLLTALGVQSSASRD